MSETKPLDEEQVARLQLLANGLTHQYSGPDGKGGTDVLAADVRAVLTALAEAQRERDEARAFGENAAAAHNHLLAQMTARTLTCVYCGHEYPAGTPASGHITLEEHIAVCEKHPLRAANAALAAAQANARTLREALEYGRRLVHEVWDSAVTEGVAASDGPWPLCSVFVRKAQAALSAPADESALREIVTRAVADAGRYAAKIAELYESKWGVDKPDRPGGFADTASAAILTDLCDPDDPDTVRIVNAVLGAKEGR